MGWHLRALSQRPPPFIQQASLRKGFLKSEATHHFAFGSPHSLALLMSLPGPFWRHSLGAYSFDFCWPLQMPCLALTSGTWPLLMFFHRTLFVLLFARLTPPFTRLSYLTESLLLRSLPRQAHIGTKCSCLMLGYLRTLLLADRDTHHSLYVATASFHFQVLQRVGEGLIPCSILSIWHAAYPRVCQGSSLKERE